MCEKEQRGWEKSCGTSTIEAAVSNERSSGTSDGPSVKWSSRHANSLDQWIPRILPVLEPAIRSDVRVVVDGSSNRRYFLFERIQLHERGMGAGNCKSFLRKVVAVPRYGQGH